MSFRRAVLALVVIVFSTPAFAAAQDDNALGVTMGYPGSIGLIFKVSDNVAVRPEFSFGRQSVDGTATSDGSSTWSVATGASALFYLARKDSLRPYVAPRFTYEHSSGGADTSANGYGVAGLVGAQYDLGARFSVFGETGLKYDHSKTSIDNSTISFERSSNGIGTITGVGVIVRF